MYRLILITLAALLPCSIGADTNGTETEVEIESDRTSIDGVMIKMLSSTQRLVEEGCTCYLIYSPICATDGEAYANDCFLECAKKSDPYLFGVCYGECPCCKKPYENHVPAHALDGVYGDDIGLVPLRFGDSPGSIPSKRRPNRFR